VARTVKMTKKRQKEMIELLGLGHTITYACELVGVHRNTEYKFRRENSEYAEQVENVLVSRVELVEDALFANAIKGDVGAQKFWLMNRANKDWKSERYHKIAGDDMGVPVTIIVEKDFDNRE
jgi:hypothetical protein